MQSIIENKYSEALEKFHDKESRNNDEINHIFQSILNTFINLYKNKKSKANNFIWLCLFHSLNK